MRQEKKIYISGKITGLDINEAKSMFKNAAQVYREKGWDVINPLDIDPCCDNPQWNDYMRADIAQLITCSHLHAIPNWQDSKGAKIELQLAKDLGIEIIYG